MNPRAAPHRKSPMSRLRLSERSWFSWVLLLLLLLDEVFLSASLQQIQAFVGESIILPCSNPALRGKPTVFWRYRDSGTVYDIIRSRELLDEQEESFRGRVKSFTDEWANGDFSIELIDVRKSDGGPYTCFIPAVSEETKIVLTVKDALRRFSTGLPLQTIQRRPSWRIQYSPAAGLDGLNWSLVGFGLGFSILVMETYNLFSSKPKVTHMTGEINILWERPLPKSMLLREGIQAEPLSSLREDLRNRAGGGRPEHLLLLSAVLLGLALL